MAKKRIAILFGGTSPEHDISCMSAWYLLRNMPPQYETVCIGITRKGRMLYYPGDAAGIRSGDWESYPDCCSCIFSRAMAFCLLAYWLRSSIQTTDCPVGR